jgi:hypothetical protein
MSCMVRERFPRVLTSSPHIPTLLGDEATRDEQP